MRNLRLKSIFNLDNEHIGYEFVNCSFDYNGNLNILLVKGEHKNHEEDSSQTLLVKNELDYKLIILSDKTEIFEFNNTFNNFNYAFKVSIDKYLFACSHFNVEEGSDYSNNCKIYNFKNQIVNEFCAGSYFNDIQIGKNGEIWVAEGDIAILGNWAPAKSGLCCFNINGQLLYKFDSKNISIYDCDAINVTGNDIWFYYYTDSKYIHIIDKKTESIVESPVHGVKHFSLLSEKNDISILMDGGFDSKKEYNLFDLKDNKFNKGGVFQFVNENDEILECCRSQGEKLCFWKNNNFYLTTIDYVSTECFFMGDKLQNKYIKNLDNKLLNAFLTTVLNKQEIENLITQGANINAVDEHDESILFEVLFYQDYLGVNLEIIQYLIDLGADVNHKIEGFNSLYHAGLTQNKDLVELLIKNGADVNCVSTDVPESLLNWAEFDAGEYIGDPSQNMMEEVVQILIKYGAKRLSDIERETGKKWTSEK